MKEIKNLSKIRLFVGIVITAVAMFIFMPINVFATTDYEIYVNGEQFTSEKTTINCGDGTATFDISTNTLILNNATITKGYGDQYAVINSKISNLTIQLIGDNVIDGNKGEYDGIDAGGGRNVVIVGDGNLTIKDVYYGTYIGDYSVPGGNLKIKNTTINIENAQATGIWVNHDLEIINSNIKIDKTGDDLYFGIVSNIGGTITIDGGNLDINTNSHCILLGNGDNSNHDVVIKSGNIKLNSRRDGAYGIKFEPVLNTDTINGNIKIDGGNLEISTIAGGTNIDDSKITINSKLIFREGTSLKDNGKILLNEAKTVTFDSNGGSAVTAQSIEAGQKATKPADPTKDGYDFKGWTLNGSAYDFNTAVNGNITLVATWEQQQVVPTTYTVSFEANGGAVTPSSAVTGAGGKLTSLPTPTRSGYTFNGWYTAASGGTKVDTNYAFTANTTIYAQWTYIGSSGGGSYTPPTYKVESTVSKDDDGTVSFSKNSAKKGDTVTITVTPDRYYKVDGVTVKDKNGNEIAVTDNGDGTFTFKMPDSKVAVEPVFSWDNPFGDVAENTYYAPAVEWALKNEVTGGTTTATFSPNTGCTRAQIVTFLWRAAGCPESAGMSSFTDVSADAYYAKAVAWAAEQGITGGTGDGKFSPDAVCTRSQSMTFIYRSEQAQGGSMQGEWMFQNPFADVNLEDYYGEAVMWAVANGVTSGTSDTTFSPNATCTRGQIVTFLYRFFVK